MQFIYDEVPTEAHEIEDILVAARKRDEELAKARENAQYAGDVDPYKKPREIDSLESEEDEYSEDESEEDESLEDDATSEDESEDESL